MTYQIKVVLEAVDDRPGLTRVTVGPRVAHHLCTEAISSGVCMALSQLTKQVGSGDIDVKHGLTVHVRIKTKGMT